MSVFKWDRLERGRARIAISPRRGWAGESCPGVDKSDRGNLHAFLPLRHASETGHQKRRRCQSLSRVMVHVFSDGVTNWGRIVTLISFGTYVAKHLKSINRESCIEPLAESITDVLLRSKRDWIVKEAGMGLWSSSM